MKLNRLTLAAALALPASAALASSSCSSILDSLASSPQYLAEYQKDYPECFPSSSPATTQQIGATTFQQISTVSTVLGNRLLGGSGGPQRTASLGASGMAAGGAMDKWNAWASASQNANRYDAQRAAVRMRSGVDVTNVVLGADYRLDSKMVVGVSAAFDRGTGTLGVIPSGMTSNGYSIAPYLGYQLSDKWALDAAVGFGEGETSVGASRTDSDRTFLAANATYADWIGNWQITGKGGYLWSQEKSGDTRNNGAAIANTAATATLGQARLGVEAGYWYGNGVMPFVGLTYSSDVQRKVQGNAPWDRDAFILSLGVNFFSLKDKITGGVVYSAETGRSHTRNDTLMGNLNVRF